MEQSFLYSQHVKGTKIKIQVLPRKKNPRKHPHSWLGPPVRSCKKTETPSQIKTGWLVYN